ncbi:MAG TPA: hypothetical protein VMX75_00470 [Spirochaetia bacterium]|nr:hypothetical protein [Spirochaetia bacterium]
MKRQLDRFLPFTDFPVIRARVHKPRSHHYAANRLYDLRTDYTQRNDLSGGRLEETYRELLISMLKQADAPPWQFERLGLVPE